MIDPIHPETGLVDTTKGPMDPSLLRRVDHKHDNEDEHVWAIEFYDVDELVHRSVHVTLKKMPVDSQTDIANFG